MENLLTVREVAERVKAAPFTVRTWLKRGDLRAIKLDKAWRVPESALAEFLQSRERRKA